MADLSAVSPREHSPLLLTLLPSHEVDEYYRYKHIHHGYRSASLTFRQCMNSLLFSHNQQWNALTMLSLLPLSVVYALLLRGTAPHIVVLFVLQYWFVAPFSFLYHTAQAMGVEQAKLLCKIDYFSQFAAAIVAQYTMSFYALNDELMLRTIMGTVSITVTCAYALLIASEEFDRLSMSRVLMLIGPMVQGFLVFIPVVYSEYTDGFARCGLWAELIVILIVCVVTLWLLHFPERLVQPLHLLLLLTLVETNPGNWLQGPNAEPRNPSNWFDRLPQLLWFPLQCVTLQRGEGYE